MFSGWRRRDLIPLLRTIEVSLQFSSRSGKFSKFQKQNMDKYPPDRDFFVLERHKSNDSRDIEIARAKVSYQLLNMFGKLKKITIW